MTELGDLLKEGFITIDEGEKYVHLRNTKGQDLLYSREHQAVIPFTIRRYEEELEAIRNYDGWGMYK